MTHLVEWLVRGVVANQLAGDVVTQQVLEAVIVAEERNCRLNSAGSWEGRKVVGISGQSQHIH